MLKEYLSNIQKESSAILIRKLIGKLTKDVDISYVKALLRQGNEEGAEEYLKDKGIPTPAKQWLNNVNSKIKELKKKLKTKKSG